MSISDKIDLIHRLKNYTKIFTDWFKKQNLQTSSKTTVRLGLWGTKGSGKTTYLAMLYDALELSEKWTATVDNKARDFVEQHIKTIKEDREFPLPTETSNELDIFSYTLRFDEPSSVNNSTIVLDFIDAPGEFYEEILKADASIRNLDAQTDAKEEYSMDIVDYLISCDGIIFLLDPVRSEQDGKAYSTLLRNLFLEFQERSRHADMETERIEQYIAFCINKVDHGDDLWSKEQQKPDELAQKVMGMELKRLKNYCWVELDREKRKNKIAKNNRCEFFPISSIGRYKDKDGKWQEAVVYPEENTNSAPKTQFNKSTEESSEDYNRSRNRYNNRRKKPEATNTNTSSSSSSSSNWGISNNTENEVVSTQKALVTIKSDAKLLPYNVLEPIEWLIRGIQNHPPSRSNPSSSSKED